MNELINLKDFLSKRYEGFGDSNKLVELQNNSTPGVVIKNDEVYLSAYKPDVETLYHQGFLMDFDESRNLIFNNIDNLKNGYFGSPDDYTYLSTDRRVKASTVMTDVYITIDYKKMGKKLYRDPETLLKEYHHEWDRAFIVKGSIPKSSIIDFSFPELENQRLVHILFNNNIKTFFENIKKIRKEFKEQFQ